MIKSVDLFLDMSVRTNIIDGAVVTGENINLFATHLNAAIRGLISDAIAGKSTLNPLKQKSIKKALRGATTLIDSSGLLQGSVDNGALKGPQLGSTYNSSLAASNSKAFATFASIPDDSILVESVEVEITDDGVGTTNASSRIRQVMDVIEIESLHRYSSQLRNHIKRPNENIVWWYQHVAGMFNASDNAMVTDATSGEHKDKVSGYDWATGANLDLEGNTIQLVCGGNWRPLNVRLNYLRYISGIFIDLVEPAQAKNLMLDDILRDDIVDYAVKRYTASKATSPEGYQIQDAEAKEN